LQPCKHAGPGISDTRAACRSEPRSGGPAITTRAT
jgi:hypothetical protein